jgi:hypothetical protein
LKTQEASRLAVVGSGPYLQLIADAEKIKADGEKLLGINDIAAPMAPEPPKAA